MRRIPITLLIVFLFSLNNLSAYAQSGESFIKTLNREKAYLHFDKPYYAIGDTIYFKAYVTLGPRHRLSDLSGVLHIDLIDPTNKIAQSIKLKLANGLAWGDFTLADTLSAGDYRIRAYTRWMLNEDNIFEQTIPVGSIHAQKVPESNVAKTTIGKPDLQFFPEGGQLVAGLPSKVAFKAVGVNGLSTDLKGTIRDNTGKIVSHFAPAHLGMGSFELKPEEGKTYKANVIFADGSKSDIGLPLPKAKGVVLTVNNDSIPNTAVRIEASPSYYTENKGKDFNLQIYSGGVTVGVQFKLDSPVVSLNIIKRLLQTGEARLTLLSQTNEPLCERLFFIQNYDQINLAVNSNNATYTTKGKANIKVNARNRADSGVIAHFSVSVVDESKVAVDENTETTILTNLLLTSDLKGFVEQPNYYFSSTTDEPRKNLDLVMLTHGYRKFEWEQAPEDSNSSFAYLPENGLQIDGLVKNVFGKPLANATASLLSLPGNQLFSTTTNDKGLFRFSPLAFTDTMQFILQAVNAKGKNNTELVYNEERIPAIKTSLPAYTQDMAPVMFAYLQNSEKQQEELNKAGLGKGRILKEVKVKSIKPVKYETESLAGAGFADQVIHNKDFGNTLSLPDALSGKLMGIRFTSSGEPGGGGVPVWFGATSLGGGSSMLVVVDGLELPPTRSNIDYLRANDVETVEVLTGGTAAIYGFRGSNGVLVITRKKGKMKDLRDIPSFGVLPITVQGYQKVREFYSPKYESNATYALPDLRSTIYWQPELITDKDGNASFEYYNADSKGTYRVVVEGIDEKGHMGRQVYRYKVD
ncbi:carboxypeptidase-like regulatory domain-containing protein [Mucilaginibacter sp. BT774]|uniref:carboxypeptidase-like regulatory domain-containing protein n=1 Tax=Mucilaginibacter sp. BT774 TaxID=3062276 RepID=UPI002675DE1D|nr:TonB-dependent receptor plug domain-containing protein [Mucilaginibacter sp. BT774]MDO3627462.1 TonB-dependent receptor plug domain-containing protein [Mucilaginibacter sp. BT774]